MSTARGRRHRRRVASGITLPPGFGDDEISRAMRPCATCGGARFQDADGGYYCPACRIAALLAEVRALREALAGWEYEFRRHTEGRYVGLLAQTRAALARVVDGEGARPI